MPSQLPARSCVPFYQNRQLDPRRSATPVGGIAIELRGGVYELAQPLELTALDSGDENAPIIYRARQGETVKLIGERMVTGWKPLADRAVLNRLDPAARGQVWQADLKVLGITDLQGINNATMYQSDPRLEVFFQDKPMALAHYPNSIALASGTWTAPPRSSAFVAMRVTGTAITPIARVLAGCRRAVQQGSKRSR